ncbi:MAG: hypothetical protein ACXV7J_07245 [Methylomonas sp.]
MMEQANSLHQELREIERFIDELLADAKHPVHHRMHSQNGECLKALNELMEHANTVRSNLLTKSSVISRQQKAVH